MMLSSEASTRESNKAASSRGREGSVTWMLSSYSWNSCSVSSFSSSRGSIGGVCSVGCMTTMSSPGSVDSVNATGLRRGGSSNCFHAFFIDRLERSTKRRQSSRSRCFVSSTCCGLSAPA